MGGYSASLAMGHSYLYTFYRSQWLRMQEPDPYPHKEVRLRNWPAVLKPQQQSCWPPRQSSPVKSIFHNMLSLTHKLLWASAY